MYENIAIIFSITLYKLTSLFVGTLFAYLGYKLFMAGVWGNSGDLDAQFKDYKLVLKKAAPGTFFVAFGAIIIGITIYRGIGFENINKNSKTPIYNKNGYARAPLTILPDADELPPSHKE